MLELLTFKDICSILADFSHIRNASHFLGSNEIH